MLNIIAYICFIVIFCQVFVVKFYLNLYGIIYLIFFKSIKYFTKKKISYFFDLFFKLIIIYNINKKFKNKIKIKCKK
jgi:hypothetical protein